MAKVTGSDLLRIKAELNSAKQEELRLIVSKDVAARFRRVAKAARMTTAALFTEMVEAHALGMNLKTKSE